MIKFRIMCKRRSCVKLDGSNDLKRTFADIWSSYNRKCTFKTGQHWTVFQNQLGLFSLGFYIKSEHLPELLTGWSKWIVWAIQTGHFFKLKLLYESLTNKIIIIFRMHEWTLSKLRCCSGIPMLRLNSGFLGLWTFF